MKKCSKCGETKCLAFFCKNRKTNDGLNAWCKACIAKWKRENRKPATAEQKASKSEYDKNRRLVKGDELRAKKRISYHSNSGKEKRMQWYWKNHDRALELAKSYRDTEAGREKKKARAKNDSRELKDWYVRRVLTKRANLKAEDVPNVLVQAKRMQLLIERECREKC